ncbi:MAG TPA: GntR family transcriptional regulator [Bryobacteraceae bacterium]|jgi:DNA-binding GntR family transcriptional regulator|nr:GntR family transcriptional regulator [Bryobacteraceae bacterium]
MPTTLVRKKKAEREGELDRVYRTLREWLIAVRLRPGEFLSEVDLAAQCRTSRTPVREACGRLAQDKWLVRIPRKGYLVAPISVRDIVELYEFRRLLECFSAEKVARSASREQLEELRDLVRIENDPTAKLEEILPSNQAFHLRLAEIAGNQRVVDELKLALGYVRRLDTLCTQTVPGWIPHTDILAALESHRPQEAQQAMALHIDSSRDKMIKLFGS